MKSIICTGMMFMLFITSAFSQESEMVVTDAEWNTLVSYYESQQWGEVEKISTVLLRKFNRDQEESLEAGGIRYIYLCSVAVLLGEKQIDEKEAAEKLKGLKGRSFVTNSAFFKSKELYNSFKYSVEGKRWVKCFSKKDKSVIYLFEFYDMADASLMTADFVEMEGKVLRLKGTIKDVNIVGIGTPRVRAVFSNAEILDVKEQ